MIDIFFSVLRKVLVGTVLVVFAFVVLYVPQPFNRVEKTEAAFPVTIVGPAGVAIIASGVANTALTKKESILDGIGNALAKSLVTSLTSSIVQWINNGFKGSPAFISDLDGFLLDVADQAAGQYISEISELGSFICSPFQLDIQIALSLKYQATRNPETQGCRLSDMVSNVEDFIAGEFSQGGWNDWFNIVAEPTQYTPYGQLLEADARMEAAIRNAEGKELRVAGWGGGFLSGKLCEVVEGSSNKKEKCVISKPGQVIAASLNKALGAGQDALISADEINEIISALLGQIAAQALTGAAGLLGLSANTRGGGGSYLNQMNQQSLGLLASSTQDGARAMEEASVVQTEFRVMAEQYIPRLQAYIANTRNTADKRNIAQDAYSQAQEVIQRSPGFKERIDSLREDYADLEQELTTPNLTVADQQNIKRQQLQVLQAFYQINAYSRDDIAGARQAWEAALRP